MNGKPVEVPGIDQLLADPAKVQALPPETARTILIGFASLHPLLIQRAMMPAPNGPGNSPKTTALTAKQVAERLNVKTSFIYDMARSKKLDSYKVGEKYVRFTEAAVEVFLKSQGG